MSSTGNSQTGARVAAKRPESVAPHASALRKGWTTGCCAALAAKAAAMALLRSDFPSRVSFRLPGGQTPEFEPVRKRRGNGWAECGIIKDAGDDPDVTHGATIVARVSRGTSGNGVALRAGPGVGMVTLPGLPVPVGEPAINPVPRKMIRQAVKEASLSSAIEPDLVVTLSVPGGEDLALRTWNPRLGIVVESPSLARQESSARSPVRPGLPRSIAVSTWQLPGESST